MNMVGSIQRLCLSGWLLAAMILITISWFDYVSMENRPLDGSSRTIISLRSKLAQLQSADSANRFKFASLKNNLGVLTGSKQKKPAADIKAPDAKRAPQSSESGIKAALPSLAGILQAMDDRGDIYYQAVLDGKVYQTKDRVMGFTIQSIRTNTVVLRKNGIRHVIKSPEVFYSNDQGH